MCYGRMMAQLFGCEMTLIVYDCDEAWMYKREWLSSFATSFHVRYNQPILSSNVSCFLKSQIAIFPIITQKRHLLIEYKQNAFNKKVF